MTTGASPAGAALGAAAALSRAGRYAEAVSACKRILAAEPANAAAWRELGSANAARGRTAAAVVQLERAAALGDVSAPCLMNLAGAAADLGRLEEAARHYRRVLDVHPGHAEAYFQLAHLGGADDRLLHEVEALLREAGRPDEEVCHLGFAAGRLCDRAGDHDRAARHYVRANAARRAVFDAAAEAERTERIEAAFSRAQIEALAGAGHVDPRFVFVIGMPRSGTTLVEQILGAHPRVGAAGELPDVTAIARTLGEHAAGRVPYPEAIGAVSGAALRGFGAAYAGRVGRLAPAAARIVDKAPLNFRHLGLIALLLPQARFVHCVRHPLDTCLSCFFQNFADGHAWSFSREHLAGFFLGYRRLMSHWRDVLGARIVEVRYEALVSDPPAQSRRLVERIGLEWDPACLDRARVGGPVHTASRAQVREPITAREVGRWRHYRKLLAPVARRLARW